MKDERVLLKSISEELYNFTNKLNVNIQSCYQIVPLIVGNNKRALEISTQLENLGFIALPIRTTTVPKGTERIRFSLNASLPKENVTSLIDSLKSIL